MLTVLNDPAGITGCRRHAWDTSVSLQANIQRHVPDGGDGCEVRIDGLKVDPLCDARFDAPPRSGMLVTIVRRPAETSFVANVLAFRGAEAITNQLVRLPTASPGSAAGKESPNNQLTAQSNVARAYQGVPDVYGFRRVWPDLIQPSTVEYIDQVKYITEWLSVSRGKGTITAVQYAETPIGDIDGASYQVFEPVPLGGSYESGATTVNDVYETFGSPDVNGQELPYATAFAVLNKSGTLTAATGATTFTAAIVDGVDLANLKSLAPSGSATITFTYSGGGSFSSTCTVLGYVVGGGNATFTFTSPPWVGGPYSETVTFHITPIGASDTTIGPITLPIAGEQIWWSTVFLRGLNGTVNIVAEWWKIDGAGAEIPGTRQSQTNAYTAATYDQRYYTNKVTPAAGTGRYRAQFTRTTVQVSTDGADVAKIEMVAAVRHYATKTFPGVTILRVTTKATLAATGVTERKFNLRFARWVRTLSAVTASASRNFGRILAHVWTTAGNDIAQLDTDALADINAEFGEDSPLLRYDGSLDDSDISLGERMQTIANTARCFIWRDGAQWTVTRDQARTDVEMQLDYRTLAASGDSSISYAAHLPASHDGIEIEYVDEASQSKKSYVRISNISGTPVFGTSQNPLKIRLTGCATQAQAENRAQMEARRLLYQRTNVSDTALADVMSLGIGSLVRWIDPNDFGGDDGLQAGEVLAITGTTIATSEPLDFQGASSGRILLTGLNGRFLGPPVVCTPADGGAQLASVPSGLYVADSARQLGSRYSFAVGLTEAEIEAAALFLATEIRPAADGTASLACVNYDSRIYEAD